MQKKGFKLICVLVSLLLVALVLTSCDVSTGEETPEPVAVTLKTDLHDAMFTFTYGELETVLPTELLSTLFEEYE